MTIARTTTRKTNLKEVPIINKNNIQESDIPLFTADDIHDFYELLDTLNI